MTGAAVIDAAASIDAHACTDRKNLTVVHAPDQLLPGFRELGSNTAQGRNGNLRLFRSIKPMNTAPVSTIYVPGVTGLI
jgi:hypothetical protein